MKAGCTEADAIAFVKQIQDKKNGSPKEGPQFTIDPYDPENTTIVDVGVAPAAEDVTFLKIRYIYDLCDLG